MEYTIAAKMARYAGVQFRSSLDIAGLVGELRNLAGLLVGTEDTAHAKNYVIICDALEYLAEEVERQRAELQVITADGDRLRALCDELAGRAEHAEMEVAALCGGDYDAVKTERDALARKLSMAKHVLHGFSLAMNGWGWHQEKAREALAALDAREEGARK